jgi:hypothetical protein
MRRGKIRSGWVGKVWVMIGLFGWSLIRLGSEYRILRNVRYCSDWALYKPKLVWTEVAR